MMIIIYFLITLAVLLVMVVSLISIPDQQKFEEENKDEFDSKKGAAP